MTTRNTKQDEKIEATNEQDQKIYNQARDGTENNPELSALNDCSPSDKSAMFDDNTKEKLIEDKSTSRDHQLDIPSAIHQQRRSEASGEVEVNLRKKSKTQLDETEYTNEKIPGTENNQKKMEQPVQVTFRLNSENLKLNQHHQMLQIIFGDPLSDGNKPIINMMPHKEDDQEEDEWTGQMLLPTQMTGMRIPYKYVIQTDTNNHFELEANEQGNLHLRVPKGKKTFTKHDDILFNLDQKTK